MLVSTVCTESQVSVPSTWKIVTIVIGCVLAFTVVLLLVLWPLRYHILLFVKLRRRTTPDTEGNRDYK